MARPVRMKLLAAVALISLIVLVSAVAGRTARGANEVNLYSYRQEFLIKPLLDAFTRRTGITVNVVYAKTGILERLRAEGRNSPADMVLTADVGNLDDLVEAGLAQAVHSPVIEANIPPQYRDPEELWFGLTTRARVIYTHKTRVKPGAVANYEDLVSPRFKGRICSRSGKHVYNISLLASFIVDKGAEWAEEWARGVKANLARRPQGNDRAQVKAIYQGECDLAIGNSYYLGKMATNERNPEQKEWAAAVNIVFPNQDGRGTHVNVSGALITKSAKNRDNAVALLTFLSQSYAQRIYAQQNFEYPVKAGVPLNPLVASWGTFKADTVSLAKVARYRSAASRIMDRVSFDN